MTEIYISWSEYYEKIERLAVKIYESKWQFNQIVCLAKGGLRVGDILARLYDQPLAILSVASYGGEKHQMQGALTFSRDLSMTTANLGSQVLLVDDLADSGLTLERSLVWLDRQYGFYIEHIRTAVLWYKARSCLRPDYYVDYLPDNPWIHQPFEPYEALSPEQLAERFAPES